MGYRTLGIACVLVLAFAAPASADWHSGTFLVEKDGNVVGEQEFTIKRGEESGKWFLASSGKGSLPKGSDLFTIAQQLSPEGAIEHYKTVQKRKGEKPLRGIYFARKGKLRCIPVKGSTKPVDVELTAPDTPIYDSRILATWFVPVMRMAGEDGTVQWASFDVQTSQFVAMKGQAIGSGEVTRKKKAVEVQVISVNGGGESWVFATDSGGRILGGQGKGFRFVLKGVELGDVLLTKASIESPPNPTSELDAIGLPGDDKEPDQKSEDGEETQN